MPTVPRRRNARPGHLVVCGDQSLAFLLTEELTTRYREEVKVILAMLEHQVLRTIPVGRHVLLIADVPVDPDSELEGAALQQVHEAGQARVIALRRRGVDEMDWKPHRGYLLAAHDRMIVLATSAGLGWLLARSTPGAPLRPRPH